MIVPCIDLMDGMAVQLVRGREKKLEVDPMVMLRKFRGFPVINVIDLDAALGTGNNDKMVARLCRRRPVRVGGGVRSVARVRELVALGAQQIIIGTAAFGEDGVNEKFLRSVRRAAGKRRIVLALDTSRGRIVVRGWRARTGLRAEDVIPQVEPYCGGLLCTYVDKEGMMQGTNLRWFARLRAATRLPIIAAGGITTQQEVDALEQMGMDAAVGMAVYTGKLRLVAPRP
ncbi:MAG: 1-(5-phosphoribosyl)-5-[(5-phosphoribosylamino)methylideneamino] imidazole-4-carboxamide isomerase [Acidobacteria bacterium]|nr:1-(5-phosphoribosyl)-5-[(5-phosphoribosylamino)methylideneamino] imidazole-4-carboxamide isomerase [Acidobacteriota bacterium]